MDISFILQTLALSHCLYLQCWRHFWPLLAKLCLFGVHWESERCAESTNPDQAENVKTCCLSCFQPTFSADIYRSFLLLLLLLKCIAFCSFVSVGKCFSITICHFFSSLSKLNQTVKSWLFKKTCRHIYHINIHGHLVFCKNIEDVVDKSQTVVYYHVFINAYSKFLLCGAQ